MAKQHEFLCFQEYFKRLNGGCKLQPPLCFFASDRVADGVSDRVCRALFHTRRRVDVGAEREARAEVAERFRQRPHVHAAFQRQGRECVSHIMKTHMFRADLLDDPIMQPAKSIRVPRFPSTWRWEQIRIRRVPFMFFYEKFYRVLRQ